MDNLSNTANARRRAAPAMSRGRMSPPAHFVRDSRLATFVCAAVMYGFFIFNIDTPLDFKVINFILFFFCLSRIVYNRVVAFGLYHIFYVFHIIFFCIIPQLELSSRLVYWGGSPSILDIYAQTTLIAVFLVFIFDITYNINYYRTNRNNLTLVTHRIYEPTIPIILSIVSTVIIYWYNGFSIYSVLFRGGGEATRQELASTSWLVFQYALYPMPSICFIFYLNCCKKGKIYTLLLFILMLIANPFTGMARFQAAALYIAAILSAVPGFRGRKLLMSSLLMLGMFFVFPLLDMFRRFNAENFRLSWSTDFLYQGHFDSFQSLARVLDTETVTWGRQLLGALLFFVPRSLWLDKPIGSGAFLANKLSFVFSNISMNYFAEGYINFGIAGAFIFAIFAGWSLARLDRSAHFDWPILSGYIKVFYLLSIGLVFFVLRGDLLSSISYVTAHFLAILLIVILSTIFSRKRFIYP